MYKNLGPRPCASRRLALKSLAASSVGVSSPTLFAQAAQVAQGPLKIGFVFVTPVTETGWTAQHNLGRVQIEKALGSKVQTRYVENVPEGPDAERVIRDLASEGHQLIFTTSFGYMEPTLKVAKDFPKVAFEHVSGYKNAANVGTVNARFYEGRYLAGMIAGKMSTTGVTGYVAAFPIPEVLQGINAFTLGIQAVNPKAQVKVIWTSSWFDPGKEREAAMTLINQGADVLAYHTGSSAVLQAAEERGRFSVGYHSDMSKLAPKGQLVAVTHHWGAYYTAVAQAVLAGTWKPAQPGVWGGIAEGFIQLTAMHPKIPADFVANLERRRQEIATRKFHPFSGLLKDNEGRERQASGSLSDAQLGTMNYFVAGVQGSVPKL
jgi:basic membrane protein A and related proteins